MPTTLSISTRDELFLKSDNSRSLSTRTTATNLLRPEIDSKAPDGVAKPPVYTSHHSVLLITGMDIHRCRFVPYPPQAINALAFTHEANPKQKAPRDLRLAIGRENGSIEIWNPASGNWYQESILRGSQGRTIDQLVWTQDFEVEDTDDGDKLSDGPLRLFSTGAGSSLVEWDLQARTLKKTAESNFGDIWSLAAQPRSKRNEQSNKAQDIDQSSLSQMLAAGCHDGSIVLFTTEHGDLRYLQSLAPPPNKKVKPISLTWRDRNTVIAGYDDSTIRVINTKQRSILRQMSLGKSPEGGNSVVWAVRCLPDGSILSGDSSGELKIWDAKHFALVQRIKAHDGDVLDIAVNAAGDTITTVGVDRRSVVYRPVSAPPGTKRQRWTNVMHRRYHENDAKCCAAYESKDLSIVVSGGADTVPIVASLRGWQKEYHRKLSHLPQVAQMSCSPKARLMLTWWDQDLYIWHLPKRTHDSLLGIDDQPGNALLACLRLKGDEHVQSAELSQDGKFVVAGTAAGTNLFQLRKVRVKDKTMIRTRPIDMPKSLARHGAQYVGFLPNQKWIYTVNTRNEVLLAKMNYPEQAKERPTFTEQITRLTRKQRSSAIDAAGLGEYSRSIGVVAISPDSRTIAVGDISGAIDTWVLEGHEDLDVSAKPLKANSDESSDSETDSDDDEDNPSIDNQRWIRTPSGSQLPTLDSAILSLTFKPTIDLSSDQKDEHLGLHPTRHNPNPLAHDLPHQPHFLVAITATHQLVEFDVLNNKMSDWSRRNPSSYLPSEFQKLTDRITGCFWDVLNGTGEKGKRERLWMYGANWMCMLDMAHDLAIPKALKRTSEDGKGDNMVKRRKKNSGAGDEFHRTIETNAGVGNVVKKFKDGGEKKHVNQLDQVNDVDTDDEEEDRDRNNLVPLRRAEARDKNEVLVNGHSTSDDGRSTSPNITSRAKQHALRSWWITHKYRSIFGIQVIGPARNDSDDAEDLRQPETRIANKPQGKDTNNAGEEDPADGGNEDNLEVVIVERPLHDISQPDRFDDRRDWES